MENESMEDLQIKYNGESQLIEANTLINSLLHFTTIVQETNRELQPESKVEIKIRAHKEGSFIVDLLILSQPLHAQAAGLFVDAVSNAGVLVEAVGKIYNLAKFLRGSKPKKVETVDASVKIENNYGDITYIDNRVFNVYQDNASVRNAISQEFKTLSANDNITGLEILGKDKETIVSIPQEEFAAIASSDQEYILPDENILHKTGILYIVSLSFEEKGNWVFIHEGNKHTAKIRDEEFTKLIESGEKFAKGDCLEAVFEIRQQYEETYKTFINKSLKVLRIIKHFSGSEQKKLFN